MNRAVAEAHPNIALVKYWGKRDRQLNLPAVSSLSLTLGPWRTRTAVSWGAEKDAVSFGGHPASDAVAKRVLGFLDRLDPGRPPCVVETDNDFPTGAGLASSASGFAALALAATAAAGRPIDAVALSRLARQGSGSACRSIFGGYVRWNRGERPDGLDSHATPIAPPEHWDLRMVVAVVDPGPKSVGSTEGMERSRRTSNLWDAWVAGSEAHVAEAHEAVLVRDLQRLGEVMERSTFEMHATLHSATPPLMYWRGATVEVLHEVFALRARGVGAWATMDAGPQVKVLCAPDDAECVADALRPLVSRVETLVPGGPARVVE